MNISEEQLKELERLLDQDAGPNDGVIDEELAGATEAHAMRLRQVTQEHISNAHEAIAKAGKAHAAMRAILTAVRKGGGPAAPVTTGLRPGTRVAQVGEADDGGTYRGTIDPATLTRENWAYYQQRNLGSRAGDIFNRAPVIGDASKGAGHRYTPGDLATATPNAGPLAQFG